MSEQLELPIEEVVQSEPDQAQPQAKDESQLLDTNIQQQELIHGSMNATAECRALLRQGFFPGTKGAKVAACVRFLDALYDQQKEHLKSLSKQK